MIAALLALPTTLAILLGGIALPVQESWTSTPEGMIRARWDETGDADTMVRVAIRESCGPEATPRRPNGCTPDDINCAAKNPKPGSTAEGMFQTLWSLHGPRALGLGLTRHQVATECWASVELAWDLYLDAGTTPWAATRGR